MTAPPNLPSLITELPGPRAKELLALSERYEPRSQSEQVPLVWDRAEGVTVWDIDGNAFLDFTSGVLVANVGHSHPRLVRVMQEQAARVVNTYDFLNAPRVALARKLVEMAPPSLDRALILSTGAESTEAAIKVARRYTGNYEIIAFQGAFHGRTMGALSLSGSRSGVGARGYGPFLPGVVHAPFPYEYRCLFCQGTCTERCFDYLERVVATQTEGRIAAVITEAYQGGAGSIMPPAYWMQRLEAWCRANGALFIVDEVQSSFGRTGKLFCFQHYGVTPNLLCLGKGISSSVPVAALMGEARIMDVLEPGAMSSTHGGNAFCSRVALENLAIIEEEGLVDNAARLGQYVARRFADMATRFPHLGQARGLGLVWGLEIVADAATRTPDALLARRIIYHCFEKGLLLIAAIGTYGNVIRIAPPLVISADHCKVGLDILESVLAEVST